MTQEISRGLLQCRHHSLQGLSVSGSWRGLHFWLGADFKEARWNYVPGGGGGWIYEDLGACTPRMSGFSNLWCVNALRVRGWPGLHFIRDAIFHC